MSTVQLPPNLASALKTLCTATEDLRGQASALSDRYRRAPGAGPVICDSATKMAYLAVRLPATYAAVHTALRRFRQACPDLRIRSLLDAGAGPGTASLAVFELEPDITAITQSDLDATWRGIAQELGKVAGIDHIANARWVTGSLDQIPFAPHDLVVAAYALNELPENRRDQSIRNLWAASDHALVLVEPGTPRGFLNIQRAREIALELGAHIAAPCTHASTCPMSEADWCHTSIRVPRSAQHQHAKSASLSYEDEKFSYMALTRAAPSARPASRIVKRPVMHSGHVQIDLCTASGLVRTTVSRRHGNLYRAARKAEWGDDWTI